LTQINKSEGFLKLTKIKLDPTKLDKKNLLTDKEPKSNLITDSSDTAVVFQPAADIDIDNFNDEIPSSQNTVQNPTAKGAPTQEQYNAFIEQMKQRDAERKAAEEAKIKNADSASVTNNKNIETNPIGSAVINKDNNGKIATNTISTEDLAMEQYDTEVKNITIDTIAQQLDMRPEKVAQEMMNLQQKFELTQGQALLLLRAGEFKEAGTAQNILDRAHADNEATMQKYSEQYNLDKNTARLLFRAENGLEPAISKYAQLNNMSLLDAVKVRANALDEINSNDKKLNTDVITDRNNTANTINSSDIAMKQYDEEVKNITVETIARQLEMNPEEVVQEMMNLQQKHELTQGQALLFLRAGKFAEKETAMKILNRAHQDNEATMQKYSEQYNLDKNTARLLFRAENGLEPAISKYAQLNNMSLLDAVKVRANALDEINSNDKKLNTDVITDRNNTANTINSSDIAMKQYDEEVKNITVETIARQLEMNPEEVVQEMMNLQQKHELTQGQALLFLRAGKFAEKETAMKILNRAHQDNEATMQKYSEQYNLDKNTARLLFRAENGLEPAISKYAQLNNMSLLDAVKTRANALNEINSNEIKLNIQDIFNRSNETNENVKDNTVTNENVTNNATSTEEKYTVVNVADELRLSYQEVGSKMGQLMREQGMSQQEALEYILENGLE